MTELGEVPKQSFFKLHASNLLGIVGTLESQLARIPNPHINLKKVVQAGTMCAAAALTLAACNSGPSNSDLNVPPPIPIVEKVDKTSFSQGIATVVPIPTFEPQNIQLEKNVVEQSPTSVDYLAQYMKDHAESVDYKSIVKPETQLLAIGEEHPDKRSIEQVEKALQELKSAGFTHFAIEMISSDLQEDLDKFTKTGDEKSRKILVDYLNNNWQYKSDEYFNLIFQASYLGYEIIALGMPASKDSNDPIEETKRLDKSMKKRLAPYLAKNKIKIISFSGLTHGVDTLVGAPPSMAKRLEKDGINTESILILRADSGGQSSLSKAVQQSGQKKPFMISFPPESKVPFDEVVFGGK